MQRLRRDFFSRYTPHVASDLLGCLLVRERRGSRVVGRIVEVEAYRGKDDPASHSYRGATKRSSIMFGEPGRAYVFFSYGTHWCLNFTTEREGEPGAVLVRALEPVEGVEQMLKERGVADLRDLANGPGKLTKALSIDGSFNGEDLVASKRLWVEASVAHVEMGTSPRIGISRGLEKRWRFYEVGNSFVSKGKA